jgi:hypothetical protein
MFFLMRKRVFLENFRKSGRLFLKPKRDPWWVSVRTKPHTAAPRPCASSPLNVSVSCVVGQSKKCHKNAQVRSSFSESSLIVQKGCELVLLRSHTQQPKHTRFAMPGAMEFLFGGKKVSPEEQVRLATRWHPYNRLFAHTRIMFLLKAHSQEKKLHWFLRQTRSPCARPPGALPFLLEGEGVDEQGPHRAAVSPEADKRCGRVFHWPACVRVFVWWCVCVCVLCVQSAASRSKCCVLRNVTDVCFGGCLSHFMFLPTSTASAPHHSQPRHSFRLLERNRDRAL